MTFHLYVVEVEMAEKHGVDVAGTHARGTQFLQQPALYAAGHGLDGVRVGGSAADAGVHQDGLPLRPDQVALEMSQHVIVPETAGVALLVGRPGFGGDIGEHVA